MSAHKVQLPPPLPDQQVIKTCRIGKPEELCKVLKREDLNAHSKQIKRFIEQGYKHSFTAILVGWRPGETCLIAYYHIAPGVPFINLSSDIKREAYKCARNPIFTGLPVLSCRFDGRATNGL